MNKPNSGSSNPKKNGNGTKTEQKIKSKTPEEEEVKKDEIVESVVDNTNDNVKDVNAEEETWNSKVREDFDPKLEIRQENIIMTQNLKKISLKDNNENIETPSGSNDKVALNTKTITITGPNYDDLDKKKTDAEFDNFLKLLDNRTNTKYTKVKEIDEDLFKMSNDYSLAHCVAEDLNMSSGIAVQFSLKFKKHGVLSNQRQKQGGLAIISFSSRFIYYLVTKKYSNGKPTIRTVWNSLKKMQKHVQVNNVKQVAIPRIGCGLDRLKWTDIKFMIEHIFKDTDVEITVCNFQQTKESASACNIIQKCKIVQVPHSVSEIEPDTMIVYFGTEDGFVDNPIKELNEKFHILPDYERHPRVLGQVVQTDAFNGNYLVFGFIVKKSTGDFLDYTYVQKCTQMVNIINEKFGDQAYQFLALDVFQDPSDDELQFHHVLNILRTTLTDVDVYVCYPKDLMHLMPKERIRRSTYFKDI